MGRPMIITGALPGQEQANPDFAEGYGMAKICENPDDIASCIENLSCDGGKKLLEMRKCELDYRDLDSAKKIVEYIRDFAK